MCLFEIDDVESQNCDCECDFGDGVGVFGWRMGYVQCGTHLHTQSLLLLLSIAFNVEKAVSMNGGFHLHV